MSADAAFELAAAEDGRRLTLRHEGHRTQSSRTGSDFQERIGADAAFELAAAEDGRRLTLRHEGHRERKERKERFIKEGRMTNSDFDPIPAEVEWVGRRVIGCAVSVHRALGPGYKESIYVEALCLEMESREIAFEREKPIVVMYREWEIPGQRLDLIVGGVLVVECKATDAIAKIHTRQATSYLKTTGLRLAFIFNFNVDVLMREGFERVAL
jgi:GxxExxY protein